MTDKAPSAGGVVKINTDYLKGFASKNLEAFIEFIGNEPHVQQMAAYAEGGSGGVQPGGIYNQILPSNVPKGGFDSGRKLQEDFHNLAGVVDDMTTLLLDNARQMQVDLEMIASVIGHAAEDAEITAAQMQADLANISWKSRVPPAAGTGSGVTADPPLV